MHVESLKLKTQAMPASVPGKALQFPLVRILVAVAFLLPFVIFHNNVIGDLIASAPEPRRSIMSWVDSALSFVILLACYALYVRWIEKRKALEISTQSALSELGAGWAVSFAIVAAMVGLIWIFGYYRVEGTGTVRTVANAFFFFGFGAFLQVLLFRVILFRMLEEILGTWLAILLVAAIFGLVHMGNDNATVWSGIAVVAEDIFMIAPFVLTRRLWMAWGIHWSWNFTQDGIFGMPNSGITDLPSWINASVDGPTWLTGGSFGIEASFLVVIISIAVGLFLMRVASSKGQIVSPVWRSVGALPEQPS
jgi:membrane protease YdiL (CAAX protease family)